MPAAARCTASAAALPTRALGARQQTRCPAAPPAPFAALQALHRQAAAALGTALLSLSAAACTPASTLAANLTLGREVFQANCAVCHAGGLNNIPGEEKHTLKRDALEKYGLFSQQAIESQVHILADGGALRQVRSGKDAMPPFQGSLSDDEIAAVAAFVYNQAAGDLWGSS